MSATHRTRPPRSPAGFTLVEVMVVIAILGIVGQVVLSNIGALVPSSVLDSEAQKLMGELEVLRSEAQLQGKVFKLELDLDENRYRRIYPAEMRISLEQDEAELQETIFGWNSLDDRCRFLGYEIVGSPVRDGRTTLVIDHNGFTGDQAIYLSMHSEDLRDMIWTIELRGLDRRARLIKSVEGKEARPEPTLEGQF